MEKSVIVLGAKGRFGRSAVSAFANKGWRVTALARHWEDKKLQGVHVFKTASAFDRKSLSEACAGHDVIVNAINPPYEDWEHDLPIITKNVIAAGLQSKASVMIPGNVYNYGNGLPATINEETPHVANTKKGRLRIEMEQSYRNAMHDGLRTIILRGGDFIEGNDTGNWFETYITNKLHKGIVTYPGSLNAIHSWAYLPDMARVMASLADKRTEFHAFEEFGFRGYAVTGQQLINALSEATQKKLVIKSFPWLVVRMMGLFSKQIHEVIEMRYLWNRPHEIDDAKLRNVLHDFVPTPLDVALNKATGHTSETKSAIAMKNIATASSA